MAFGRQPCHCLPSMPPAPSTTSARASLPQPPDRHPVRRGKAGRVRLHRDVLQPKAQARQERDAVTRRVRTAARDVTRRRLRNSGLFRHKPRLCPPARGSSDTKPPACYDAIASRTCVSRACVLQVDASIVLISEEVAANQGFARRAGLPEGIRTPDLRFRKPLLYPAELPGGVGRLLGRGLA